MAARLEPPTPTKPSGGLIHRRLGQVPYEPTWRQMQRFTETRDEGSADELWTLEHPPTYTLGLNGRREHVLEPGDIPLVAVDRGGQVTYHGPGQVVAYLLVALRRHGLGVRRLVSLLEEAAIEVLAGHGIKAYARPDAPGVYVGEAKIAAVGLRIRRGCSYHGLSLNADMDLEPFSRIDPCGYRGLAVTDMRRLGVDQPPPAIEEQLAAAIRRRLNAGG